MRVPATAAHNRWHPDVPPVATVAPGEEVTLVTRDGLDGQLTRSSTHADILDLDLGLGHPLTGPVFVEGAEPGDVLVVELVGVRDGGFRRHRRDPRLRLPRRTSSRTRTSSSGRSPAATRAREELPGVAVPEAAFAGVIGVAPSTPHGSVPRARAGDRRPRRAGRRARLPERAFPTVGGEGLRTIPPRETGGNLDVRGLGAGSRLFLPVTCPGALFSVGDLHFAQGDGEVCGTGSRSRAK